MLQDQIRTLRKAANLSQRQLAQKIGMSQQALAKYENGQATPNPTTLSKLAHVLGVSVDHLLGNRTDDAIRVPVLGQVAAGIPIERWRKLRVRCFCRGRWMTGNILRCVYTDRAWNHV